MTGPEHYQMAEDCLNMSGECIAHEEMDDAARLIARAHVHATLALAAATVATGFEELSNAHDDWREVTTNAS